MKRAARQSGNFTKVQLIKPVFSTCQCQNHTVLRHHFCNGIHNGIGDIHNAPDVADNAARRQRTKGDDLHNAVLAVFAHYVVNNLLPAFKAKININIRHGNTFRVEESFKQ